MVNGSFDILLLEDAEQFLATLTEKAKEKVMSNMRKVAGGVKDRDLFKKLDGAVDIWEFRIKHNGMEYRFLAFWDKTTNSLVVATHGFIILLCELVGQIFLDFCTEMVNLAQV